MTATWDLDSHPALIADSIRLYHILTKHSSEARVCPSFGELSFGGFRSSWTELSEENRSLQSEIQSLKSENQTLKSENDIPKSKNRSLESQALVDQDLRETFEGGHREFYLTLES
jgi:hypothetical protein